MQFTPSPYSNSPTRHDTSNALFVPFSLFCPGISSDFGATNKGNSPSVGSLGCRALWALLRFEIHQIGANMITPFEERCRNGKFISKFQQSKSKGFPLQGITELKRLRGAPPRRRYHGAETTNQVLCRTFTPLESGRRDESFQAGSI